MAEYLLHALFNDHFVHIMDLKSLSLVETKYFK